MFKLYDKRKSLFEGPVTIYSVRNDRNGYPQFLIFEKGEWRWVSAKHFKPNPCR